ENTVEEQFSARGEKQVGYFTDGESVTGTTDNTTMLTFGKIQGGSFTAEGPYLRAIVAGNKTGTAATADLILDIGGTDVATLELPADAGVFRAEFLVASRGE